MSPSRKALFLDRDGTLITDVGYLNDVSKVEYLPGVFRGLRKLRDVGYEFVVVTNQSGLARGRVSFTNLLAIHRKIRADFARQGIEFLGFYWAPFLPESQHFLRKPQPGMLLEATRHFHIDLKRSWMVGDQLTDVQAGLNAGTRSLLLTGEGARALLSADAIAARQFTSWAELVAHIMSQDQEKSP